MAMPKINNSMLPTISADLLLVHAPAFFDFRNRKDIYFPYLGTSGDVPITPLYEYFPVGFKSLKRVLSESGHDVKIVNLSSVLLKYPKIDVEALIKSLDVKLFGIDLHWMVHVQGSLAVASLIKEIHPQSKVIFGGISSTYYAEQLIRYPFIDFVMRGYDTHASMTQLLSVLGDEQKQHKIQNLIWKNRSGEIIDNGRVNTTADIACGIDWSSLPDQAEGGDIPILEVLSTQNVGCPYNCGWCGGSREAFRRVNGITDKTKTIARKAVSEIEYEFDTMQKIPNQDKFHFYAVGSYTETRQRLDFFLDQVARSSFRSISYEQFHLTPDHVLRKMAAANPNTTITLSPESHDVRISKLSGRGVYTMKEMEAWIAKALDIGIRGVDIWFFIGMPEQDAKSVQETVDYCGRLLKLFKGKNVTPLLCPMIPFLDPASTFFEYPEQHGYRVFHRTVEEHRRAMESASLLNRINYETKWLSRADLVHVGYQAVRRLTELKVEAGMYPRGVGQAVCSQIDDAVEFIDVVHQIDCIADPIVRGRELAGIGDEILQRNNAIFFSGVANQSFPIERDIGGRWFDELLWDAKALGEFANAQGQVPPSQTDKHSPSIQIA